MVCLLLYCCHWSTLVHCWNLHICFKFNGLSTSITLIWLKKQLDCHGGFQNLRKILTTNLHCNQCHDSVCPCHSPWYPTFPLNTLGLRKLLDSQISCLITWGVERNLELFCVCTFLCCFSPDLTLTCDAAWRDQWLELLTLMPSCKHRQV